MPSIDDVGSKSKQFTAYEGGTGQSSNDPVWPAVSLRGLNGAGTWETLKTGLSAVLSSVAGLLNPLPYAQYLAAGVSALTNGQFAPLQVNAVGALKVDTGILQGTPVATLFSSLSTTSTQLLGANTSRIGATFCNFGGFTAQISITGGNAATTPTHNVAAGATLTLTGPMVTGIMTGCSVGTATNLVVTELT